MEEISLVFSLWELTNTFISISSCCCIDVWRIFPIQSFKNGPFVQVFVYSFRNLRIWKFRFFVVLSLRILMIICFQSARLLSLLLLKTWTFASSGNFAEVVHLWAILFWSKWKLRLSLVCTVGVSWKLTIWCYLISMILLESVKSWVQFLPRCFDEYP